MEEAVRAISTDGLLWGACKYNEINSLGFYVCNGLDAHLLMMDILLWDTLN
jgi:hypothetical protein